MSAFSSIAKIPELKRRIIFTLLMLVVYRLGCQVPTPGIDADALMRFFAAQRGTIFGLFDMFSGGALERLSVFALGIMPYISAAIIIELLKVVIPAIEKLYKEGEAGQKKIKQYTRYGTVVIAAIQGIGIAVGLECMTAGAGHHAGGAAPRLGLPPDDGAHPDFGHCVHHVAGGNDHRAGHRQRHLADHLCRDRGPDAFGPDQYLQLDKLG